MSDEIWIRKVERELGQVSTRLGAIEKSQAETDRKVTELRDAALRVRGGWWVITFIASVGAALGAALVKLGMLVRP